MRSGDFDAFMAAREEAAKAHVTGDAAALDELVPHQGEATYFTPLGDAVEGASAAARRYREDSQAFRPDGTLHFEVLQKGQSGDLAFWTGYEVGKVHSGATPDAKDMRVRVTEVFRRISGDWKLIHRHAENEEVRLRTPPTED